MHERMRISFTRDAENVRSTNRACPLIMFQTSAHVSFTWMMRPILGVLLNADGKTKVAQNATYMDHESEHPTCSCQSNVMSCMERCVVLEWEAYLWQDIDLLMFVR